MPKFAPVNVDGIVPDEYTPEAADIISGNPRCRSWDIDKPVEGHFAGIWEGTPGKWRFENTQWEYCRILSGVSIVTEDGGEAHTVKAGDSFILRSGFKGTWEVIETTRKDYVIRM